MSETISRALRSRMPPPGFLCNIAGQNNPRKTIGTHTSDHPTHSAGWCGNENNGRYLGELVVASKTVATRSLVVTSLLSMVWNRGNEPTQRTPGKLLPPETAHVGIAALRLRSGRQALGCLGLCGAGPLARWLAAPQNQRARGPAPQPRRFLPVAQRALVVAMVCACAGWLRGV